MISLCVPRGDASLVDHENGSIDMSPLNTHVPATAPKIKPIQWCHSSHPRYGEPDTPGSRRQRNDQTPMTMPLTHTSVPSDDNHTISRSHASACCVRNV